MTVPSSTSNLIADLNRMQAEIAALPPAPRRIIGHHSVPYGRVFHMWNTHGDMIAYANAGELHDLPRAWEMDEMKMTLSRLTGIPVVFEP